MPRHPGLQSLHQICLNNIVENMDNVWCSHFLKELSQQTHWLFVEGPFDTIHPQMCDVLINRLHSKKMLKRHHIYLLVNPGLQSLTLESSNEVNTNLVLQLLAVRCRKLLKLVLNQSKFRHDLFHDVCEKSSENLTELKLAKTQIGDLELAIIGSFCPKLKHLDVGDVTKVSDKGLLTLYKQVNLQGKPSNSHGKCSKMVSLDIRGTSVSIEGVASALESLSETLIDLEYHLSFAAVLKFANGPNAGLLKLRKLEIDLDQFFDEEPIGPFQYSLRLVTQFCPHVQRAVISYSDGSLKNDDLMALIEEPRIITNIFLHSNNGTRNIEDGLVSLNLMLYQGNNLRDVTLIGTSGVSLTNFLNLCPKLENLHLDFNTYSIQHEESTSKEPLRLQTFRMHCNQSNNEAITSPSSSELGTMLSRASDLRSLDITGCDKLTAEAFQSSWGESSTVTPPFPLLRKLRLVECNFISFEALSGITHCSNDLENLELDRCREVHRSHVDAYRKFIDKNRFSVNIFWR